MMKKAVTALFLSLACHAAESRPVRLNLPLLECNERKAEFGVEADCVYKTAEGDWEIGYSREGRESRTLKNKLKNLVVLLHPSENDHRLRQWWKPLVGPGNALDPEKNVLLSIGVLGDRKPKIGSEKKLTLAVTLEAMRAVIDRLYPGVEFDIGGPSRGGQMAYLYAQRYPEQAKGLFMVSGAGFLDAKTRKAGETFTAQMLAAELAQGAVGDWGAAQKRDFLMKFTVETLDDSYTPAFFRSPDAMTELGKTKGDFKDEKTLRKELAESWTQWSLDNTDILWFEAQFRVALQGLEEAERTKSYRKLPKEILLVRAESDQLTTPAEYAAFVAALRAEKKKVTEVKITDSILGHMTCCSWPIHDAVRGAIREFLAR